MKLTEYSQRYPGRLAARLLLRMQRESSLSSVGATLYARSSSALLADNDAANSGAEGERESGARTAHALHGVGLDGTRKDASSGRHRSPTGKSPRKSLQRRPQGSSSILGAHRGGATGSPRSSRAVLLEQGVPAGAEAERVRTEQSPAGERRSEGLQGKRRQRRSREGSLSRKRKGQSGHHWEVSAGPENSEIDVEEARRTWRGTWGKFMEKERPALEVLSVLFQRLHLLESPLGKLAKAFKQKDMPPRADCPKTRGDDLLPMDLTAVQEYLTDLLVEEVEAIMLVVLGLNYMWLGGRDSERYRPERDRLTKAQRQAVSHLAERVRDLGSVDKRCPDMLTGRSQLVEAKFDYGGEPIMSLEELKAEQVIPVWPAVGEAAVQHVTAYLPDDLRERIENPESCLLPKEDWPHKPPKSPARATQDEWNVIVQSSGSKGTYGSG